MNTLFLIFLLVFVVYVAFYIYFNVLNRKQSAEQYKAEYDFRAQQTNSKLQLDMLTERLNSVMAINDKLHNDIRDLNRMNDYYVKELMKLGWGAPVPTKEQKSTDKND